MLCPWTEFPTVVSFRCRGPRASFPAVALLHIAHNEPLKGQAVHVVPKIIDISIMKGIILAICEAEDMANASKTDCHVGVLRCRDSL